jgi:chromosome segregation ATPase
MNMPLDKPLNLSFEADSQSGEAVLPEAGSAQAVPALVNQVNELKKELRAKNLVIDAKNQEISELRTKNRQLMEEVSDTHEKQKLMDEELRKAEEQIELIMELIGEDDAEQ